MHKFSNFTDIVQYIDPNKPLFVDLETYNDYKHYKGKLYGKVRLAMFMQEGWKEVLVVDLKFGVEAGNIKGLRDIVLSNHVIGQGFYYDFAVMQDHDNREYREIDLNRYDDILYRVRDLFPEANLDMFQKRYTLDKIYLHVLGFNPYEQAGLKKTGMQKANWGGILTMEMLQYAAIDVYYNPQLWAEIKNRENYVLSQYTPEQVQAYHTRQYLSKHSVKVGLLMQSAGLYLHYDNAVDYIERYKEKVEAGKAYLNLPDTFNFDSPKQVSNVLGLSASNKTVLSEQVYVYGNERAKTFMEVRSGMNRLRTVRKWYELMKDFGAIYGHFSPATTTGRYSSSQENLQNQPRDSKSLLTAPDGGVMLGFDYAQIELRTMCALTNEPNMYKAFREFKDVHNITKETCNISERVVAKRVNFGFLYGMGVTKFRELLLEDGIVMGEDELKMIKDTFQGILYPNITKYHEVGIHKSKHLEPNLSLMGHPYLSKYFNQMNNMANQASGTSEVAKWFFYFADEVGLLNSNTMRIALQVHDSNIFYCSVKPEYLETYTYAIALLAQKAWFTVLSYGKRVGVTIYDDIPMPVEVGVASTWGGIDDNILTNLQGLEYLNNVEGSNKWLQEFAEFHKNNQIKGVYK